MIYFLMFLERPQFGGSQSKKKYQKSQIERMQKTQEQTNFRNCRVILQTREINSI